jgi:hypothetical protein
MAADPVRVGKNKMECLIEEFGGLHLGRNNAMHKAQDNK